MSEDFFGIKPIGKAVNAVTNAAIKGASAFLGRICLPAAEEFGLLLKDRVSCWRLKNFLKISERAEIILRSNTNFELRHAHPRLVFSILEHGSWSDDTSVQDMWAGLLSSSCTLDGQDESNLIFINLLSQLTKSQARLLNYSCEKVEKYVDRSGLICVNDRLEIPISDLPDITLITDVHVVDRELDHLRSLGLIEAGIITDSGIANIAPTALGLYMYVRCKGSYDSPVVYFRL